ncbi:PREDICTED: high-affinity choline transporter 1-like isoform X2 [Priapulus caudatus]|uniref:High-affinity choline transporter 1-like isoform X2 n=1 Tax=Priapulus caudatus TaxID=37621 RepID=A0ABM1E6R7_PRICU|nr:PREDICTED: high-affinity choline transporter 1-like isoform X2 [Priapulus caudatus]
MEVDVWGLAVLAVLYAVILGIGIYAAKVSKARSDAVSIQEGEQQEEASDMLMVANRKLSTFVGVCTMTATFICGSYINGTAQSVAEQGLVWTLAPPGIFLGMIIGGLFFAKKMRDQNYITFLDPFEKRFGEKMTGLLFIAAFCAALGTSIAVIVGLDTRIAIVASAIVAIIYTVLGQMLSVAYTDVVQLAFMSFGLLLGIPFVLTNEHVGSIMEGSDQWLGTIENKQIAVWIDFFIVMIFGSIPWQSYFQRVLSARSGTQAQYFSIIGSFGAFLLAIPPVLIGAAGSVANWTAVGDGVSPLDVAAGGDASMVLPLVLHSFTPRAVSLLGLCALSAAVMSSIDSAILGSSSMFTHNIYRTLLRSSASSSELLRVQRGAVVVVGGVACAISLTVTSVLGMFVIAADVVFVALLPQLVAVVYCTEGAANTYGSLAGLVVAVLLRLGAGEPLLGLPPLIYYGALYDAELGHLFPYRTFAMLASLATIVAVSSAAWWLFVTRGTSRRWDVLGCFVGGRPLLVVDGCSVMGSIRSAEERKDTNCTCKTDPEIKFTNCGNRCSEVGCEVGAGDSSLNGCAKAVPAWNGERTSHRS